MWRSRWDYSNKSLIDMAEEVRGRGRGRGEGERGRRQRCGGHAGSTVTSP